MSARIKVEGLANDRVLQEEATLIASLPFDPCKHNFLSLSFLFFFLKTAFQTCQSETLARNGKRLFGKNWNFQLFVVLSFTSPFAFYAMGPYNIFRDDLACRCGFRAVLPSLNSAFEP